jgi:hypothetical protein
MKILIYTNILKTKYIKYIMYDFVIKNDSPLVVKGTMFIRVAVFYLHRLCHYTPRNKVVGGYTGFTMSKIK